jgi:hypothetical protein
VSWQADAAAVYGKGWQSRMARHLDLAGSTVRRWVAGSHPVPEAVLLLLAIYAAGGAKYDRDTNRVGPDL